MVWRIAPGVDFGFFGHDSGRVLLAGLTRSRAREDGAANVVCLDDASSVELQEHRRKMLRRRKQVDVSPSSNLRGPE